MEYKKIQYYFGILALVVGGFLAYYLLYILPSENVEKTAENEPVSGAPSLGMDGIATETDKKPSATEEVKNTSVSILVKTPNLDRQVYIPASVPSAQKEEISNKIKEITALLNQDANLFNEWLDLGSLRKSIEDYEGAREAWEYASAIRPKNSLSFTNLATLYGYYLQSPILAEKNYMKAIENDPALPYLYMRAADFYIEVLDDSQKAKMILQKGVQTIPEDEGLKAALENL